MLPIPSELEKEYPPRGPLRQYRFRDATAFHCFRCGVSKEAKLITIYAGDWDRRLCNGCYGRLLSIHEIKSGTADDDEKTEQLARILLTVFNRDQEREAQRLFRLSERRVELLSETTLRFLATADHVSRSLSSEANLDWSPAVIGLCKAVELEVIERLIRPLATDGNIGCPHEEGEDFPSGEDCPFCPFWKGKQGSARRE